MPHGGPVPRHRAFLLLWGCERPEAHQGRHQERADDRVACLHHMQGWSMAAHAPNCCSEHKVTCKNNYQMGTEAYRRTFGERGTRQAGVSPTAANSEAAGPLWRPPL